MQARQVLSQARLPVLQANKFCVYMYIIHDCMEAKWIVTSKCESQYVYLCPQLFVQFISLLLLSICLLPEVGVGSLQGLVVLL